LLVLLYHNVIHIVKHKKENPTCRCIGLSGIVLLKRKVTLAETV